MLRRIKDHAMEFILIAIFFSGLLYAATTAYQVSFSVKGLEKQQADIGEELKKQREDIGERLEKQQIGIEKQQAEIVKQLAATNDNLKKMRLTLAEEKLKSGDLSPSALRELWSKLDKEEQTVLSEAKVIAEKRLAIAQVKPEKQLAKMHIASKKGKSLSREYLQGIIQLCSTGANGEVVDSLVGWLNQWFITSLLEGNDGLNHIGGIIKQVKYHQTSTDEQPAFHHCVVELLQTIRKADNKVESSDGKSTLTNSIGEDDYSPNFLIRGDSKNTTIEGVGNSN